MKIAYILYPEVIISNKSNGIRSQAESWKKILETQGHIVDLVSNWDNYDWRDYDVIHLFGLGNSGTWMSDVTDRLMTINPNLFFSPIIDPQPLSLIPFKEKLSMGVKHIIPCLKNITNKKVKNFRKIFVRSDCEKQYMMKYWGVNENNMAVVPLSYTPEYDSLQNDCPRSPFCLHISSIYQPRKNVIRLINAAKKYGFELVLAGNKGNEEQYKQISEAIGDSTNIKVLGFISEAEKIKLYQKAKVFALPSIQEGVGIVAIDAALLGCEIVVTNIPGPKEYYAGMAKIIDPYNVDDIGRSVVEFLNGDIFYQSQLSEHIHKNFSPEAIYDLLIKAYK